MKACSSLNKDHQVHFVGRDGSSLISSSWSNVGTDERNGNGSGTDHDAFLRALGHSEARAKAESRWPTAGVILAIATPLIVWLATAAKGRARN